MTNLRKMITAAALLTVATGISSAAQITYTTSQGPTLTDFIYNLTLPKFDPSIGILTGATIRFTATDTIVSLNLTNTSNASQTFKYVSTADFFLNTNSADATLIPTDLLVSNFNSGFITLGPAGSGACPAATPSAACNSVNYSPVPTSANTGDVAVVSLGAYNAVGTFTLGGNTITGTTFTGGGGNISSAQVTNGLAAASVTYTYTVRGQTPEPATMGLMGSALLGLALIGRNRSKR